MVSTAEDQEQLCDMWDTAREGDFVLVSSDGMSVYAYKYILQAGSEILRKRIAGLGEGVATLCLTDASGPSIETWLRFQEGLQEPLEPMPNKALGDLLIFLQKYKCEHAYKNYIKVLHKYVEENKTDPIVTFRVAATLGEGSLCAKVLRTNFSWEWTEGDRKEQRGLDPHSWRLSYASGMPLKYYVALVQACCGQKLPLPADKTIWETIAKSFEEHLMKTDE